MKQNMFPLAEVINWAVRGHEYFAPGRVPACVPGSEAVYLLPGRETSFPIGIWALSK